MSNPLVSAVMIFLNAEEFIVEAIESILAQTYPDIELVLVDDGSSDGSAALARSFIERFPERIRMVEHPGRENRGMSASRNLGVESSRGEYIAFLDADDVWLPEKTAQQLAIFRENASLGLVYGRTQIWHSWAPAPGRDYFYGLGVPPDAIYEPPALLGNLVENKFQTPTTCNAMITTKAFETVGGFEPSFRGMYEDQVFFSKLYLSFPTYVSDVFWAKYRQHPGNSGAPFCRVAYFRERARLMEFIFRYSSCSRTPLDAGTRALIRRELRRARHPELASWLLEVRAKTQRFWQAHPMIGSALAAIRSRCAQYSSQLRGFSLGRRRAGERSRA